MGCKCDESAVNASDFTLDAQIYLQYTIACVFAKPALLHTRLHASLANHLAR